MKHKLEKKIQEYWKINNIEDKRKNENVKPNGSTKKQKGSKVSTETTKKLYVVYYNIRIQYEGKCNPGIIKGEIKNL